MSFPPKDTFAKKEDIESGQIAFFYKRKSKQCKLCSDMGDANELDASVLLRDKIPTKPKVCDIKEETTECVTNFSVIITTV